jgi:hypothetical protein
LGGACVADCFPVSARPDGSVESEIDASCFGTFEGSTGKGVRDLNALEMLIVKVKRATLQA